MLVYIVAGNVHIVSRYYFGGGGGGGLNLLRGSSVYYWGSACLQDVIVLCVCVCCFSPVQICGS